MQGGLLYASPCQNLEPWLASLDEGPEMFAPSQDRRESRLVGVVVVNSGSVVILRHFTTGIVAADVRISLLSSTISVRLLSHPSNYPYKGSIPL